MGEEKVIFGKKKKDEKYLTRIGIYALIFDNIFKKIAIIKTTTGYFLPGGGLDRKEGHIECLHREAKEEMGWEIEVGEFIGTSAAYHYSTTKNDYYYNDGYFYLAKKVKAIGAPTEDDHAVVWLMSGDAIKKLYHKNQAWAVEQVIGNK